MQGDDEVLKLNATSNTIYDISPATPTEARLVEDKLIEFNTSTVPFTQEQTPILQNHVIKFKGLIIAGINARIYRWNILYVGILFVDKNHRRKNLGSMLLRKVESEAKALGAKLAHLDTFDFQAKDFYLKQGYEIFGVLKDCPAGHERYYLSKNL